MNNLIYILLACLLSINPVYGQSRKNFLLGLDSTEKVNSYIQDHNYASFLKLSELDQKMIVTEMDQDLIDAAVFFLVNKKRKRSGKNELKYCLKLQTVANNHVDYFSSKKFLNEPKKKAYFEKSTEQILKSLHIDYGLMNYAIARPNAIKYKNGADYHHDLHSATNIGLYYGKRPSGADTLKIKRPIKEYTYRQFAKKVTKEWFSKQSKKESGNKGYEFAACTIKIDANTLHKKRIPAAACIMVFGGFKTRLINASLQQTD
ncbi:MAG: hypothetical protein JKY54_15355 [Flavobacteriales bacterium]|nr:hypothetical protein [Flavobacteriales bacterium]